MMLPRFNPKRSIELALMAALLLLILGANAAAFMFAPKDPFADAAAFRKGVEADIRTNDPAIAYRLFKQKNERVLEKRRHATAHVFGEVLYDIRGVFGIRACDTEFGFGCFHGFFIRTISLEGTGVIAGLDAACTERYGKSATGCQHGIGHGILEFIGHDNLLTALDLCATETQPLTQLLGCKSGVFMEYFFPLVEDDGIFRTGVRSFDAARTYAPCSDLPPDFTDSCYYEFAQWAVEIPEAPKDICAALSGSARAHCYMGVGTYWGYETYSVETVEAECGKFLQADRLSCKAGAAWAMFSVPEHHKKAFSVCDYFDPASEVECLKRADLTEGLDPSFPKSDT